MLNYIAIELSNYLVRTNLVPPGSGVLTTDDFPADRGVPGAGSPTPASTSG